MGSAACPTRSRLPPGGQRIVAANCQQGEKSDHSWGPVFPCPPGLRTANAKPERSERRVMRYCATCSIAPSHGNIGLLSRGPVQAARPLRPPSTCSGSQRKAKARLRRDDAHPSTDGRRAERAALMICMRFARRHTTRL